MDAGGKAKSEGTHWRSCSKIITQKLNSSHNISTMPPRLNEDQDYLVKFIVVTNQHFSTVARDAKLKGTGKLVFPGGHKSEAYNYARKGRAKTYTDSLACFRAGSRLSKWQFIARKDSNPLDVFESTTGIRELMEKEFLLQSTPGIEDDSDEDSTPVARKKTKMVTPKKRHGGDRGRSRTPNRPVDK